MEAAAAVATEEAEAAVAAATGEVEAAVAATTSRARTSSTGSQRRCNKAVDLFGAAKSAAVGMKCGPGEHRSSTHSCKRALLSDTRTGDLLQNLEAIDLDVKK